MKPVLSCIMALIFIVAVPDGSQRTFMNGSRVRHCLPTSFCVGELLHQNPMHDQNVTSDSKTQLCVGVALVAPGLLAQDILAVYPHRQEMVGV